MKLHPGELLLLEVQLCCALSKLEEVCLLFHSPHHNALLPEQGCGVNRC